jgi:hypothetical protein
MSMCGCLGHLVDMAGSGPRREGRSPRAQATRGPNFFQRLFSLWNFTVQFLKYYISFCQQNHVF